MPSKFPSDQERPFSATNWLPWIFAAKTTAWAPIALLVAFTVNLDQPHWALLTVFVVSQPQQTGSVLAKSFYRIIGTLIGGAAAALSTNSQAAVRSPYDALLGTMKDGRRLGQSGPYARLTSAEYIVSAGSSYLMHQQGCAERTGVPIKFVHIAQILNGARG